MKPADYLGHHSDVNKQKSKSTIWLPGKGVCIVQWLRLLLKLSILIHPPHFGTLNVSNVWLKDHASSEYIALDSER
jgi:hypothetical protein